jgi:hypothetical protein
MKNKKPELYFDEKGNKKGYRVGISDGTYGTCPFCGKTYTEEDVKNGAVNFEHIFPRFAVKKAIDEQKVFSRIESEFMVAVHKDCNDRCSKELEKQISRIVNNFNKPHVHLMQDDVIALFNFCIKVNIFLRYLFMWDDEKKLCGYDKEKIYAQDEQNKLHGLKFYKNFELKITNVESSAGLFWEQESKKGKNAKYSFTIVINNIEISFFDTDIEREYRQGVDEGGSILIKPDTNRFKWTYRAPDTLWKELTHYTLVNKKGIPWTLEKSVSFTRKFFDAYEHHVEALSSFTDNWFGLPKNYFIRQRKFSRMSQKRFEEKETFGSMDKGIIFCRNGQFYMVGDSGVVQNISNLPKDTPIPTVCFKDENIPNLPNISQTKVYGNFVLMYVNLTSLEGAPQSVQGNIWLQGNKLTSLQGCPEYCGKDFDCSSNNITSLKGVPKKIYGNFHCVNNKLTDLVGAPEEVAGEFSCSFNPLTTLKGLPHKIGGNLVVYVSTLKYFDCAQTEIDGTFFFDIANIESLESLDGLPKASCYFFRNRTFSTADEFKAWFKEYKKEQKIQKLQDGAKAINALAQKDKIKPAKPQHEM